MDITSERDFVAKLKLSDASKAIRCPHPSDSLGEYTVTVAPENVSPPTAFVSRPMMDIQCRLSKPVFQSTTVFVYQDYKGVLAVSQNIFTDEVDKSESGNPWVR